MRNFNKYKQAHVQSYKILQNVFKKFANFTLREIRKKRFLLPPFYCTVTLPLNREFHGVEFGNSKNILVK